MKYRAISGLLLVLCLVLTSTAEAGDVTDMAGRRVTIPDDARRVFGSAPPLNVLLHAIDPEAMIGLSFGIPPEAARFFPPRLAKLPVMGGVFGMGPQMNAEAVLAQKPDFALAWQSPFVPVQRIDEAFRKMGLPAVFVKLDTLSDWPAALRFTGALLGKTERGEALAKYVEQSLARLEKLKAIPEEKRARVYYAEGPDGLATDCHTSFHAEAFELAGGYNVYRCQASSHMGMDKVSVEQVVAFAPDVIVTFNRNLPALIAKDARWQKVKAVKEGRIHLAPQWPHNWIDRPPSYTRALGALWLANLFYPGEFPLDLKAETRDFYRLFYNLELSEADFGQLFR
ncbi:MAG: ABC transporter substrate-binding protein [Zoogloeaceae bacterium]|jgi:iron complex transport system substrate-binding protein|nr:ABC transporter substrate-binding protein [Zoogloeaceae bacterium]